MIASFALMGDIYRYDPYETEASLWNSYPWQIGEENLVDFDAAIPEFSTMKTIWELDGGEDVGVINASLGNFVMFSILILLDNFGNVGDDVGKKPDPFPHTLIGPTGGQLLSVESVAALILLDSNSERADEPVPLIGPTGGQLLSADSMLVLIVLDSNSERANEPVPLIGPTGGQLLSVSSTLQV